MKKVLLSLACSVLLTGLAACGSNEKADSDVQVNENIQQEQQKPEENEPPQKELNDTMKREAVRGEFVEFNNDTPSKKKEVFFEGKIDKLISSTGEKELRLNDYFMLKTQENDGIGLFKIFNGDIDNTKREHFKEGDTVRVYGIFLGKDELGFPTIGTTLIERM
ncbi:hypothetical protein IEQ_04993 [Bacillus cereus BAG6X1-2]|nr:hypothetical protein IEQ_04993 [Bacillus cereus BAG6X1-2]